MTTKKGFTLAEVLITLGIIGFVAAMVMPTLLNQTRGKEFAAAFKKGLSVTSQAVTLNLALDDYDFAGAVQSGAAAATNEATSLYAIFKQRLNTVKIQSTGLGYNIMVKTPTPYTYTGAGDYTFFLNDGMVLTFKQTMANCTEANKCEGFIDVNGRKGPNKESACKDGNVNSTNCEVEIPTDVYPVELYDSKVMPQSEAGKQVMYKH
jgi:prepilin-type N-terminal cleavage/methylation domain-containing protein